MSETEEWRWVVGLEGMLEVSDRGRIRSLPRRDAAGRPRSGKFLRGRTGSYGHRSVTFMVGHRQIHIAVHRAVLEAFVGPCPPGMECCHNDGDPTNNHVSNLRWDTHAANMADRARHGTHASRRRTECPHGHPYDEANTYVCKRGSRSCRACGRSRSQAYSQKKRPRRVLKPCGTVAAYYRHTRHGETPCDACRDALRAYRRERGLELRRNA